MRNNKDNKQRLLTLILAEAELERIPSSIQHHPQIKSYAKKKNQPVTDLVLDASYHHAAMKKLPDWTRRGRPDIVHRCALFALDSLANKNGCLQFYIHTRNDHVIWINPETRLPRQYHRFIGLIEQLMKKKQIISSNEVLLTYEQKTLKELLTNNLHDCFLLWEKGKMTSLFQTFEQKKDIDLTFVIGGFPHGDFHQATNIINQKIAVEQDSITASYLLAKTICTFEQVYFC